MDDLDVVDVALTGSRGGLADEPGALGYVDPVSGFFVFTAAELWARGTCCNSGCRHCPYEDGPRGPRGLPPDA